MDTAVGAAAATVSVYEAAAVFTVDEESLTLTPIVKVPEADGVPLKLPFEPRLIPAGKDVVGVQA